jgi:putative colanic acid biosynthesis acetyltransferase WcaF
MPRFQSYRNMFARVVWNACRFFLFRFSPTPLHGWRRLILRAFGAKVERGSHIYPTARIWAPWNLEVETGGCLAPSVVCYNVAPVIIGRNATVSQYSYLCTASHDYTRRSMPLVSKPIRIERDAWVAAAAFIGPGVTVHEGAVVGARSAVFKDVPAWTVVAGSPAVPIKKRILQGE